MCHKEHRRSPPFLIGTQKHVCQITIHCCIAFFISPLLPLSFISQRSGYHGLGVGFAEGLVGALYFEEKQRKRRYKASLVYEKYRKRENAKSFAGHV